MSHQLSSPSLRRSTSVLKYGGSRAGERFGGSRGSPSKRYVVCLSNEDYPTSLERRKIYIALLDNEARSVGMLRVVDESGEDYLYPKSMFAEIKVPPILAKALAATT